MQRTKRPPRRYSTFITQVSRELPTSDGETDDSSNSTQAVRRRTKTRSSERQRHQSKTRKAQRQQRSKTYTTQRQIQPEKTCSSRRQQKKTRTTHRQRSITRTTQRNRQHEEKTRATQRKKDHSDISSDDSEEGKIERRKKQKRDYARRKTLRANKELESLASCCERRKEENSNIMQQIRDLETWMKFAQSYLTLCRHLPRPHPAPQPQPAGIPGHSVTSEAELTSSSLQPLSNVQLSVYIAAHANGSATWDAAGGEVFNPNNLVQPMDPDWERQHILQTSHDSTTANFPTADPAFSADPGDMKLLEDRVVKGILLDVQRDCDVQSAFEELSFSLPLLTELL
ncbi:serine/arginine-rich splicing factor 11-like [Littorina saxatilis]|uniref:BZIP domain-containing protein n=1 Tax=Littorina saxatilis TaxID=31220 RepID=A0AAN9BX07_9CAEN